MAQLLGVLTLTASPSVTDVALAQVCLVGVPLLSPIQAFFLYHTGLVVISDPSSSMYSVCKLSTYYVSGNALGTRNSAENKSCIPPGRIYTMTE